MKDAVRFFPQADVEILEAHHNRKADAPSGTALMLAEAVRTQRPEAPIRCGRSGSCKRVPGEIGISSLRLGNLVGIHEVLISTGTQTLTLKHEAHDRSLLAQGLWRQPPFSRTRRRACTPWTTWSNRLPGKIDANFSDKGQWMHDNSKIRRHLLCDAAHFQQVGRFWTKTPGGGLWWSPPRASGGMTT